MAIVVPDGIAESDPADEQFSEMGAHDIVCVHTMAGSFSFVDVDNGSSSSRPSHFGVAGSGRAKQWRDLARMSKANSDGNWHVISIETADKGENFPAWSHSNVPAWTPQQIDKLVDIIAWCCGRFDIPPVSIPNTLPGNRGLAYHRQGIDGNFPPEPSIFAGRVPGGERWSQHFGKVCPGDRRIKQFVEVVVPRVRAQVEGDDMGLLFENRAEFRKEVLAALGGRTEGEPNLTTDEIRPTLKFIFGIDRRMANAERPPSAGPQQRGWDFAEALLTPGQGEQDLAEGELEIDEDFEPGEPTPEV